MPRGEVTDMATAETGTIAAAFERWTDPVINFSDFVWGGTWNGVEVIPFPPMVIILLGGGNPGDDLIQLRFQCGIWMGRKRIGYRLHPFVYIRIIEKNAFEFSLSYPRSLIKITDPTGVFTLLQLIGQRVLPINFYARCPEGIVNNNIT